MEYCDVCNRQVDSCVCAQHDAEEVNVPEQYVVEHVPHWALYWDNPGWEPDLRRWADEDKDHDRQEYIGCCNYSTFCDEESWELN